MRVQYFFSGREGGVSTQPFRSLNIGTHVGDDPTSVARNRVTLAECAGLGVNNVVWMDQVHSTKIVQVDAAGDVLVATDGAVTSAPGVGLAVMVADCVPILAYDEQVGVIGVAHAGRQGAAAGIGPELLRCMVSAGSSVSGISIVLGPAICGRCYEVPASMRDLVDRALPGSACESAVGTAGLDLRAGLARQFRALGVSGVVVDSCCTAEDPAFFSHRRDAPTGRQAGLLWLELSAATHSTAVTDEKIVNRLPH
ncbi:peptidoglycan editing factor PgeF [Nakamurella antarctica]|uniref:Purine nucleoside phosphorylase n=1 Tax=Nakamurella antarctica TaxID=1902245 RepID=A0A3G8ZVG8_9ACTN|nr:peptidoglycan editing factor PgeF [Nakamurella antarctica]AZI57671.1 peptidoglycan editing factor PgeF [Nakamurella antarctica]